MSNSSLARIAQILLAILVAWAAWLAWSGPFVLDEWEHLHAAWKVSTGQVPYVDFFEHHHFPIYLLFAPLLAWWPESVTVMLAARGIQLLVALGCVALVHAIGTELYGRATGWWSAALWLGFTTVLVTVANVRPDTLMTLFLFLSTLLGLRAVRRAAAEAEAGSESRRRLRWTLVGTTWSMGFVLSSKAVLFLPVIALFPALAMLRSPRRGGGTPVWTGLGALIPLLAGAAYPAATGTLGAFWDWCVRFNLSYLDFPDAPGAAPVFIVHSRPLGAALLWGNPVALALVVGGAWLVLRSGDRRERVVLLAGAVIQLLVLRMAGRGLYWDTLPVLLFPAVLAGRATVALLHRVTRDVAPGGGSRASPARRAAAVALALALLLPTVIFQQAATGPSRARDRARFEYVRDHTGESDVVHQEWPLFNLHRHDASFFWFGGPVLARRAARVGLAGGHDVRRLITRTRPAYVTLLDREAHHRWMTTEAGYRWLPELDLYERRAPGR